MKQGNNTYAISEIAELRLPNNHSSDTKKLSHNYHNGVQTFHNTQLVGHSAQSSRGTTLGVTPMLGTQIIQPGSPEAVDQNDIEPSHSSKVLKALTLHTPDEVARTNINRTKFCPNCKKELPKDYNVYLPPPIYFYEFLSECPLPWLHYGYCKPCLEAARLAGNTITEHITQCEALVGFCYTGEHENLIEHYRVTEAKLENNNNKPLTLSGISHLDTNPNSSHVNNNYKTSPKSRSSNTSVIKASESQHSSPNPYFRKNPTEYCQKCKNEVSENLDVFLPSSIQIFDFLVECPKPWLHYNYCTPCLELARLTHTGTAIVDHIMQCEALFGQCWAGQHESHIAHYKNTETGSNKSSSQ